MNSQAPQVGQLERITQDRIVKLFQDKLGFAYLGNWKDREGNNNIEVDQLRTFLDSNKTYTPKIVDKAIDQLTKLVGNQVLNLFELNRDTYELLRYGVKVREELGEQTQTVHVIDWKNPQHNHFAIAEEVTVHGNKTKRPDIVMYVNGIALGVIELKRSTVSVSEGIRQNIGNQKDAYIERFFGTMQLLMAGNDTEGLRYGTTQTPEDYYWSWDLKDEDFSDVTNLLDRQLLQLCQPVRFLEMIHDLVIFDSGIKKVGRHNQYFGIKAAQEYIKRHEGGIVWHTQGSGKSLTMVWLAKWIHENITDSRVVLLTDRTELDDQIKNLFRDVGEEKNFHRAKSGTDLISQLGVKENAFIGSLVHKFGRFGSNVEQSTEDYVKQLRKQIPADFEPQGDVFAFVDECHRSHTGKLHEAMRELLPNATFIGFTGTPLLKVDKANSQAMWGEYIHTYKYDQAVKDKVVLDIRYEVRRVDQDLSSQEKVDEWFDMRTEGLTDFAKAELKKRWGTMQTLLSSKSRLEKIVFDIIDDFYKKPRLASGRGNAMLVASSIYEAFQYYDIFTSQGFENCAVVSSYDPAGLDTESKEYRVFNKMIESYQPLEKKSGESDTQAVERKVKKMFIETPGQMQLLIVVDKLLTGFDAPPATYLYVDKNMQDHGLFQAICRVNRLHGEDKDYGYIIDYRDLFKKLEKAVTDYTSEAFADFDAEDVIGILSDRIDKGAEDLNDALEVVRALCEPVQPPKSTMDYIHYFCGDTANPYAIKENEPKRVKLYRSVSRLVRLYADLANDLKDAGFTDEQRENITKEVRHYEQVRKEIKLASGDYIDLKKYEPDMRALMDRYIIASESEQLTVFDNKSLVELLAEKGPEAIEDLSSGMNKQQGAIAETIENNVRKLITEEMPTNPRYFSRMSELLDELIQKRKAKDLEYKEYLKLISDLAKDVYQPGSGDSYPKSIDTAGKQALFDNLNQNTDQANAVHECVWTARDDDWRGHILKERKIRIALRKALPEATEEIIEDIFNIIKNQHEY